MVVAIGFEGEAFAIAEDDAVAVVGEGTALVDQADGLLGFGGELGDEIAGSLPSGVGVGGIADCGLRGLRMG
ncbi:MAG: hypothetical protein U0232_18525 [Thermomicrobiales bacterium]